MSDQEFVVLQKFYNVAIAERDLARVQQDKLIIKLRVLLLKYAQTAEVNVDVANILEDIQEVIP